MRHLQCRVSDEVYGQVVGSGLPVQRFLEEAVSEKIGATTVAEMMKSIDRRLSLLEPPVEEPVHEPS